MKVYGTTINFTQPKQRHYRSRRFRSRGALVVLLWTFTCFAVLVYPQYFKVETLIYDGVTIVLLPLAGVLSSIFNSRYKVISYSLRLMCASLFAYNLLLSTKSYMKDVYFKAITKVLAVLTAVGLSGTFPNVLSLGVDQLIDSSSSDITSYISWNAWTLFLANFLLPVTQYCIPKCYSITSSFLPLLLPLLCALSVVSDVLLNQWILKDAVTHNPLKLIYRVLKYAVRNKYPRATSTFHNWEEKKCARIDLGKAKYGGPFTSNEVEDVKTFFRILPVIAATGLFACAMSALGYSVNAEMFHYQDKDFISECSSVKLYLMNCYERVIITYLPNLVAIVLVPVLEWLAYPLLIKHNIDRISIFHKLVFGISLVFAAQIFHFSMEIIGLHLNGNKNVTCLLQAKAEDLIEGRVIQFSFKWLVIPQFFSGIFSYILYTGIMEFICAQSPYSMRGLLFGITFCICFLPFPLSSFLLEHLLAAISPTTTKNCGVWFYAGLGLFTLSALAFGFYVKKWYSPRRRDEDQERQLLISSYKINNS